MRTYTFADLYSLVNKSFNNDQEVEITIKLATGEVIREFGFINIHQHFEDFGKYSFNIGESYDGGGVYFKRWHHIDLYKGVFLEEDIEIPLVAIMATDFEKYITIHFEKEAE